jgi:putative hydrolase
MHPVEALTQAIYYLDRELAPSSKVRAFVRAIDIVDTLGLAEIEHRANAGTLTELDGIGPSTSQLITEALLDKPGGYLAKLEKRSRIPVGAGEEVRAALKGDCHLHSTWSDGGAPVRAMAQTAMALGHEYMVLTDHSARLTIAHGLDEERLRTQIEEVRALNVELAPFRILTGMEVDILEDGSLDLSDAMLAELDLVVASVHSKMRLPKEEMTRRMVLAVASPHVDVLGHCTNRKIVGTGRAPSQFDADLVFAACAQFGTAVEINCRPERQDPPEELLELAIEWECDITISTDAHAPGQMEWQAYGCDKAVRCGVPMESIVNTWSADEVVAWTATHTAA